MVVLRPDRWAAGGDAIARLDDGRIAFVAGGVPGDTVRVRLTSDKKDFVRAAVVEVVQTSPDRIEPPCPAMALGCGGCDWQHVRGEAQLTGKADIVRDALRRTAKLPDARVAIGAAVPQWGYRTTMRLASAGDGRVGLRASSSHRVVPLDACPVAHPALSALLPSVAAVGADEVTVRVSDATGESNVWSPGDAVPPSLVEHVQGVALRVTASSFFQSGPAAAALLADTVRSMSDGASMERPSLDAYGGIGLFAAVLPLRDPILVENSRSACADARVNLPGARIEERPFEDWRAEAIGLAVVDPSRAGLGAVGADRLVAASPDVVVLVSCDPVAMARDTALLAARGYRHDGSVVLDLFPQTHHVEVVTRFVPA